MAGSSASAKIRASAKMLVAAALVCVASTARAEEERGIVVLSGNLWADGARSSIEGRAMVCALKGPDGFLSLRTAPDTGATEIAKLNEMTIVELTGAVRGKWVQTSAVVYELSRDGNLLPEENRGQLAISGWVHSDYLCNYMY